MKRNLSLKINKTCEWTVIRIIILAILIAVFCVAYKYGGGWNKLR